MIEGSRPERERNSCALRGFQANVSVTGTRATGQIRLLCAVRRSWFFGSRFTARVCFNVMG